MQRFLQNSPAPFRPQFLFFSFPEKTCVFSPNYLIIFCFFENFFSFFVLAGFSYFSLDISPIWWYNNIRKFTGNHKSDAVIAQLVEHFLGKEEVTSSNLVNSSRNRTQFHLKLRAFWLSVFFQRVVPCISLLAGTGDVFCYFASKRKQSGQTNTARSVRRQRRRHLRIWTLWEGSTCILRTVSFPGSAFRSADSRRKIPRYLSDPACAYRSGSPESPP